MIAMPKSGGLSLTRQCNAVKPRGSGCVAGFVGPPCPVPACKQPGQVSCALVGWKRRDDCNADVGWLDTPMHMQLSLGVRAVGVS